MNTSILTTARHQAERRLLVRVAAIIQHKTLEEIEAELTTDEAQIAQDLAKASASSADETAESIRRLQHNVRALWQLLAQATGGIAATKIMLRSIVATVENRADADVTIELEREVRRQHRNLIVTLSKISPEMAETFKGEQILLDLDGSSQNQEQN